MTSGNFAPSMIFSPQNCSWVVHNFMHGSFPHENLWTKLSFLCMEILFSCVEISFSCMEILLSCMKMNISCMKPFVREHSKCQGGGNVRQLFQYISTSFIIFDLNSIDIYDHINCSRKDSFTIKDIHRLITAVTLHICIHVKLPRSSWEKISINPLKAIIISIQIQSTLVPQYIWLIKITKYASI